MCYYETIYYLFLFSKIRYSTEEVLSILHSGNFIAKMQCLPVSFFSCTFHAPLPCQKRALEHSGKFSTHPEPVDLYHGLLVSLQLLETCAVTASVETMFCLFQASFLDLLSLQLEEPYRLWFAVGEFFIVLMAFHVSHSFYFHLISERKVLAYLLLQIQSYPSKSRLRVSNPSAPLLSLGSIWTPYVGLQSQLSSIILKFPFNILGLRYPES